VTPLAIVTSTNVAKVEPAATVIHDLFGANVRVEGHEMQPDGPKQPRGWKQIEACAISRNRKARQHHKDAWVCISIESGHIKKRTRWFKPYWVIGNAIVIDDGTRQYITHAATFRIPDEWGKALDKGGELRPFLESIEMKTERKEGIVGHLSKGTLSRAGLYENALRLAFAPLVHPQLYRFG
jgi:inosine/xanthosine triphosphatase